MKPVEILLIEDNPGDVFLAEEAFKKNRFPVNMKAASDGVEALDFLYKRGKFSSAGTPDLILLDLNLPLKSGVEVLNELKKDDKLKVIPVIILTTSQALHDVEQCYRLHANCFINKPFGFESFSRVVKSIEDFWLSTVKLPKAND